MSLSSPTVERNALNIRERVVAYIILIWIAQSTKKEEEGLCQRNGGHGSSWLGVFTCDRRRRRHRLRNGSGSSNFIHVCYKWLPTTTWAMMVKKKTKDNHNEEWRVFNCCCWERRRRHIVIWTTREIESCWALPNNNVGKGWRERLNGLYVCDEYKITSNQPCVYDLWEGKGLGFYFFGGVKAKSDKPAIWYLLKRALKMKSFFDSWLSSHKGPASADAPKPVNFWWSFLSMGISLFDGDPWSMGSNSLGMMGSMGWRDHPQGSKRRRSWFLGFDPWVSFLRINPFFLAQSCVIS